MNPRFSLNPCDVVDEMLSRPSGFNIPWIEKNPAFNGILETAEFTALMEKYQ